MGNVVNFAERHDDLWPSEWVDILKAEIADLRLTCLAAEDSPGDAAKKGEAMLMASRVEGLLAEVKRTLNKF